MSRRGRDDRILVADARLLARLRNVVDVGAERDDGLPRAPARDERRRGKLVPGYLADLVVLDRDPFRSATDDLPHIGVDEVLLGGRVLGSVGPPGRG